jgi:hypothetical protein
MGGLILVPHMAQPTTTATTSTTSSSSSASTTSTSTTTASAKTCSAGKMAPVYGDQKPGDEDNGNVNVLGAGQCVDLTFTGPITFGQSTVTIIPSTAAGQTYVLGVLGSSEATIMSCKLPVTSTSCTEVVHAEGK